MTLHEQFLKLEKDIRATLPDAEGCEVTVTGQGVRLEIGGSLVRKISWGLISKPINLYKLTTDLARNLYKIREEPKYYEVFDDRVVLGYPNYTLILTKELLLSKGIFR